MRSTNFTVSTHGSVRHADGLLPYQSGMSGSSPQAADPALFAVADPARLDAANGELMRALSVER